MKVLIISNILDPIKSSIVVSIDTIVNVVCNQDSFSDLNIHSYDFCFILVELNWGSRPYTAYYGFEIAKEMRLSLYSRPIYFYSSIPLEKYSKIHPVFYDLTKTPLHYFRNIPLGENTVIVESLENDKLSRTALADINHHVFELSGLIDEIFHDIKNSITGLLDLNKLERSFEKILNISAPRQKAELIALKEKLIYSISEGYDSKPAEIITYLRYKVLNLIEPKGLSNESVIEKRPWVVLYIDDDSDILNKVKLGLRIEGLNCMIAQDYKQASILLEKDAKGMLSDEFGNTYPRSSILVVISDLRLVNKEGQWERLQGYDILMEIGKGYICSLFILSSKDEANLKLYQQEVDVEIFWFSKGSVFEEGSKKIISSRFVMKIIEEGNKKYKKLKKII